MIYFASLRVNRYPTPWTAYLHIKNMQELHRLVTGLKDKRQY